MAAAGGDRELVEAVGRGDSAAFSQLYRAHAPAVRIVVRSHLHDPEATADIVQEVFVRALERLSSLRDPERFRPWILAIARHAAIDQRRARARARVAGIDDDDVAAIPSGDRRPDELAELADVVDLVRGCLVALSQRDATAVSLATYLGYSPADVGRVLGVSTGTAKVILHRARRRLRDAVCLKLLVQLRASSCAEFRELMGTDRLGGAARHVRRCASCAAATEAEVRHYVAAL